MSWPSDDQASALAEAAAVKPDHPAPDSYAHAAWMLMPRELLEPRLAIAAMRAFGDVEAGPHGGFLDSGEPVILFERHLFSRLTDGRFDGARAPGLPDSVSLLSSASRGGYGSVRIQHAKLQAAVALDPSAALQATSWGLYQILGLNHATCGYPVLQRFITAMYRSAEDHLRALTMFLRHDERLVDGIRRRDWLTVATIYNGPAQQGYDQRLRAAYERLAA